MIASENSVPGKVSTVNRTPPYEIQKVPKYMNKKHKPQKITSHPHRHSRASVKKHALLPQVVILGTGIAGLFAALRFASFTKVTLISKSDAAEGATRWAQGGIASVWSKTDSFEEHISDTLTAGAELCHRDAVQACVTEGPSRVRELIELGVKFTQREGLSRSEKLDPTEVFDLHREGGHSQRRILHADDLTGLAIETALLEQVRKNPQITLLEHHVAIDLILQSKLRRSTKTTTKASSGQSSPKAQKTKDRVLGVYVLDSNTGQIKTLSSDFTIVATGGAGKVYLYTSNPDTATGDGIAMAYRAGAQVANLEFMQFHPTCLYHPSARTFLITEALRGEGAVLRTLDREEFMPRHHPLGALAPRDVVARAIDIEMKRTGDKHVWLDPSGIPAHELRKKFPNIYETCLELGIDITKQMIPVVPAAHYTCGGIQTDLNGKTQLEGLYAIGEAACTGLHGANRLASNSLLEGIVFAHRAAVDVEANWKRNKHPTLTSDFEERAWKARLPEWDTGLAVPLEERIDIAANWQEVRTLMWNYVGIVRSNRRLQKAKRRLELIRREVDTHYWNYLLDRDLIELRNLITVAELIVRCALLRKESRGLHFTVDHPTRDDRNFLKDTVL